MGRVDLDDLEARRECASGGGLERLDHVPDAGDGQCLGRPLTGPERHRARRHGGPAPDVERQLLAALPGPRHAGLPPGMGELDARDGALRADRVHDGGEPLDVPVLPDAEVLCRDPAAGGDGGRLGEDEPRPANCAASEVYDMPVTGGAVDAGVLAHGADDYPVAQREPAKREGFEQRRQGRHGGHGHRSRVWVTGTGST